ncbi:MAG: DUF3943 domain-containing protein, partial [Candidatus Latescibacterota bacterium]
ESYHKGKWRFVRASGEIIAANIIMTLGGYVLLEESSEGFKVSIRSIHENLKAGFEWDDNTFSANNFRHPYQGSLYFNAGRSNGYDFWQSSIFSFAGAWLFEYTGETHHPSINDWINTAVGGIALGEPLWRLSSMILDNRATGSGRTWREIGALLANPARGVNRLLTREAFQVHANPPDRVPSQAEVEFRWGVRTIGEERLWNSSSTKMYISLDGSWGDPFGETRKPYDFYAFGVQLNFNNSPHGLGRLSSRGTLASGTVSRSERTHHVLAGSQLFDYIDNEAYRFGGVSVAASYLSKFATRDGARIRAAIDGAAILLGATQSDYFNISGREYDYGPGLGAKFRVAFGRNRDILVIAHESYWVHAINGNEVDSYVNFTQAKIDFSLRDYFSLGFEGLIYQSERRYAQLPDVSERNPELRVHVSWHMD